MPSALQFFSRDPNRLGRGKGLYYRRSTYFNKKNYSKDGGYFSKYNRDIDRARKSSGFKVSKVGLPKRSKIPHTSDGRLWR